MIVNVQVICSRYILPKSSLNFGFDCRFDSMHNDAFIEHPQQTGLTSFYKFINTL